VEASKEVPVEDVERKAKVLQPELEVEDRIKTFEEVDLTLTPELMKAEADRCMRCGTFCYSNDRQKERSEKGLTRLEALKERLRTSPR
jgi:hypothetical protein